MQPTIMRDAILSHEGVFRFEVLDSETLMRSVQSEMSVDRITGGMKLENIGIIQCSHRKYVGVIFCDGRFHRPDECSMYMVNAIGTIIGKEVTKAEKELYKDDPNVIWLSETLAMFTDKIDHYDAKFVISAVPFRPIGMPDNMEAVLYFPSLSTAKILNQRYGVDDDNGNVWTIIIGIDEIMPGIHEIDPVSDAVKVLF